jgi:hypothetical protein
MSLVKVHKANQDIVEEMKRRKEEKIQALNEKRLLEKKLLELFQEINKHVTQSFGEKLPLLMDEDRANNYAYQLSLFIVSASKYPSKFQSKLFSTLLSTFFSLTEDISIDSYPHYYIFQDGEKFLKTCMSSDMPLNNRLINDFSLLEALLEFDILPLFVIDSSGLCSRYLSLRFEGSIIEEGITSSGVETNNNFLEALTKGLLTNYNNIFINLIR